MNIFKTTILLSTLLLQTISATAANAPEKESMHTKSGLYVDSVEAHQMITKPEGREVVLIDVRDSVEIKFTGYTKMTDIHVPLKIIDSNKWDAEKSSYGGHRNANFADDLQAQLDNLGIGKKAHLIFMCRSGSTRSAPAADIFFDKGYTNVYSMVDGFEGGKAKEGEHKGARVVSGWKNSGLPWGWKLEKAVMYGINE
jgi:rhodanese-related sulfurtransferase